LDFNQSLAIQIAQRYSAADAAEYGLIDSFAEICRFLSDNPDRLSWCSRSIPSIYEADGLHVLAEKHFAGYRKSDFPTETSTVPDEIVSIVMQEAYGYPVADSERMKREHQHAMSVENCVGALLERYLDSVFRQQGWHWCCGNFVKAIDFIREDQQGNWLAMQVKNRDNSENSSSSAIRHGTPIQKWFRSFSRTGATNWDNLPPPMQGYGLNEAGFIAFVRTYIESEKARLQRLSR